ncbi:MAG: polysaccharide biosynthesis/export family protein, partial [Gammaproteobacteria bacterium]
MQRIMSTVVALISVLALQSCAAVESPPMAGSAHVGVTASSPAGYGIHPGDMLEISVWKEKGLQRDDVLVRPDGGISFPLAGDLQAQGKTIPELRKELTARLQKFIPDPAVTVALKQIGGNMVYVIGKV